MQQVEILMPKMGESITEAKIISWLKKVGDPIDQDESLLEVATDKVDTEIPSTHFGTIEKLLAQEGDTIQVGNPVAIIQTSSAPSKKKTPPPPKKTASHPADPTPEPTSDFQSTKKESPISSLSSSHSKSFYSPLVRTIAQQENISIEELNTITGSGLDGRVTKSDILTYVEHKKTKVTSAPPPSLHSPKTPGDEIIYMDRMRTLIADRMVESKRISAHVTSFVEADVTSMVMWRTKIKDKFQQEENESFTFTPIFIEAIVQTIRDFPLINVQVEGNTIIRKKEINIGIAVALPSGNLIVPVIKNADQYTLKGLAKRVNALAHQARTNKLKPDDLSGGTYTLSNVGSFGNLMGTPIIMQPQVAILATGSIQKKPAVVETSLGDVIAIRHKMFLSHSYDHRVIDGALGGKVVRRMADYLEQFDINRLL